MGKNIGYNIRKMRELRGYDQKYMADGLGIDPTSYGHVESGKTKLSVDRLKKIAELLDTTPQAIENFDDRAIFNISHQQGGQAGYVSIYNSSLEELAKILTEPYKLQLADKDKQLANKDEQIQFLQSLIKKTD
ncbi:MAG: helix-turn-helix domain-containing protein [Bacteroidetes bacterium]|nr:helix-turn-helix domain-containing protein [Bacteroidota bacterium]